MNERERRPDLDVALVTTGTANVASVTAALRRAGVEPDQTDDPARVRRADAVVLPGVGALAPAMEQLRSRGLDEALRVRVMEGRPTLAICLGLQLLYRGSEEAPGVRGLGILDADVRRMSDAPRLPHFGWNRVAPSSGDGQLVEGDAYFAHSFALTEAPDGWRAAWTLCGSLFVSAVERDDVVACQFHPELSGTYGAELIDRWLARASAAKEVSSC